MAVIESWFDQDLKKPVKVHMLSGNVFSADNGGNLIGINMYENGNPASLGGSVSANVIRSDNTTVSVPTGTIEENKVSVILPQAAYAVLGMVTVVIKITEGSTVTTVGAVTAVCYQSTTDTVVDPGTIMPSVSNLIDSINNAIGTIPADYSSLLADIATNYSTSSKYAIGQYAWYNGDLKRCIIPIDSPESYTSSHWSSAVLSEKVFNTENVLRRIGAHDLFTDFCKYEDGSGNVSYAWKADRSACVVNGTASSSTSYKVMYGNSGVLPAALTPGETYFLHVKTTISGLYLRIYFYLSDGTSDHVNYTKDTAITVPQNAVGMIVRVQLSNGTTANNDTISVSLTSGKTNNRLTEDVAELQPIKEQLTSSIHGSCDNVLDFGCYFKGSESAVTEFPFTSGWLLVIPATLINDNQVVQVALAWSPSNYTAAPVQYRVRQHDVWDGWKPLYNKVLLDKVAEIIYKYNCFNLGDAYYANGTSGTNGGVTYTKNADGTWTLDGATATDDISFRNILSYQSGLPSYIVPGRTYRIQIPDWSTAYLQLYTYYSDGTYTGETLPRNCEITLSENVTGIILRFKVDRNKTIDNETVPVSILAVPVLGGGSGGGNTYYVNQTVYNDTYENEYNISVEPTITTDSNGWLQPVDTDTADETGKTDMTAAIMAMLTQTGYCHLAPGIFYVSGNIDMPEGSMLEGCGSKTIIRLFSNVSSGYIVKMQKYNTVKDIYFSGSYDNIPYSNFTDEKGTRHGIIFNAHYAEGQGQTEYCTINNVFIRNFTGCGIKCYNTSISTYRGVYVNQACIFRCQTGVFVDEYSEFNKFEHINTRHCYIGCENDGGNNMFIGCTFGATNTGFLIDNSLDDKANNAHGGVVGCTFCHIGDNQGVAIAVKGTVNGFTFSSCQVWYCSILIENSSGVIFTGMEFGRGTTGGGATIRISGGGGVMFTGCVFMNDIRYAPDIQVTDNDKVHFTGCYGSVSGDLITA